MLCWWQWIHGGNHSATMETAAISDKELQKNSHCSLSVRCSCAGIMSQLCSRDIPPTVCARKNIAWPYRRVPCPIPGLHVTVFSDWTLCVQTGSSLSTAYLGLVGVYPATNDKMPSAKKGKHTMGFEMHLVIISWMQMLQLCAPRLRVQMYYLVLSWLQMLHLYVPRLRSEVHFVVMSWIQELYLFTYKSLETLQPQSGLCRDLSETRHYPMLSQNKYIFISSLGKSVVSLNGS